MSTHPFHIRVLCVSWPRQDGTIPLPNPGVGVVHRSQTVSCGGVFNQASKPPPYRRRWSGGCAHIPYRIAVVARTRNCALFCFLCSCYLTFGASGWLLVSGVLNRHSPVLDLGRSVSLGVGTGPPRRRFMLHGMLRRWRSSLSSCSRWGWAGCCSGREMGLGRTTHATVRESCAIRPLLTAYLPGCNLRDD